MTGGRAAATALLGPAIEALKATDGLSRREIRGFDQEQDGSLSVQLWIDHSGSAWVDFAFDDAGPTGEATLIRQRVWDRGYDFKNPQPEERRPVTIDEAARLFEQYQVLDRLRSE